MMAEAQTEIGSGPPGLPLCISFGVDERAGTSARILVIDDEKLIGEMLAEYLGEFGLQTEDTPSGQAALEPLERKDYALLLTDLSVPGISGREFMDFVADQRPSMAIIIISGLSDLETALNSAKLVGLNSITKPFDLDQALQMVLDVLRRRQRNN